MKDGVMRLVALGDARAGCVRRRSLNVQVHLAPPAPKRLTLAGIAPDGRVAMLGARLAGKQYEFFGAVAVVVLVNDQLEAGPLEIVEAEIRDLDGLFFPVREGDAGLAEHFRRPAPR